MTRHTELVHEARKAVKRMRALARLLRYELGEAEFDRINTSLRAAGRRLSGARDAQVRLATLERLRKDNPRSLTGAGIEQLSQELREERTRTSQPAHEQAVLEEIGELRLELSRWRLVEHDFKTLEPGLGRIYRDGRTRYKRVRRDKARSDEALHDWRKRVKELYYALDMLGAGDAKGTSASTRKAERLGEALGEEHDLWMLVCYVREHPRACGEDQHSRAQLLALVERHRRRLRKRALKLGKRLYRRKPKSFTRRVRAALA